MHELSLDKQKKKLSLKVDCIHFRSLFLFAFKTRSVFFGPEERVFFRKKKEEHQKHPQSCVVLTLFSAKVRARVSKTKERERETESFFCDEREISKSTFR